MGLKLVIMGAPGAGKGTQAERIAKTRGVPHISTGEIFRQQIAKDTELGQKAKGYMCNGRLVPDEFACAVVERRLREPDCANGFVLDGFPRSLEQARQLQDMLGLQEKTLDMIINLVVNDDEIVERLAARRQCPLCGAIYNLKFSPPRRDGHCDRPECGGVELIQRDDDNETTIRERLRVYHDAIDPLLDFYEERGLLQNVDGEGRQPAAVFAKIEELIDAPDKARL